MAEFTPVYWASTRHPWNPTDWNETLAWGGIEVADAVGVTVAVRVAVLVEVFDGVLVGVADGVFVGVLLGGTGVLVGVAVDVFVGGTAVFVGVLLAGTGVLVGGSAVLVGRLVGVYGTQTLSKQRAPAHSASVQHAPRGRHMPLHTS